MIESQQPQGLQLEVIEIATYNANTVTHMNSTHPQYLYLRQRSHAVMTSYFGQNREQGDDSVSDRTLGYVRMRDYPTALTWRSRNSTTDFP